jgi:DNA-binding response OmpR family regulator
VIRHQPGVVLLDPTATDLGIVRVLRRLRTNPSVVVTGDEFAAIAFLAGGADAYVLNPISVHVLKASYGPSSGERRGL